ncbi:MAG: N-acetyltransferase ElaA, partial [uncultured Nocardioidaceae bacterium]
ERVRRAPGVLRRAPSPHGVPAVAAAGVGLRGRAELPVPRARRPRPGAGHASPVGRGGGCTGRVPADPRDGWPGRGRSGAHRPGVGGEAVARARTRRVLDARRTGPRRQPAERAGCPVPPRALVWPLRLRGRRTRVRRGRDSARPDATSGCL